MLGHPLTPRRLILKDQQVLKRLLQLTSLHSELLLDISVVLILFYNFVRFLVIIKLGLLNRKLSSDEALTVGVIHMRAQLKYLLFRVSMHLCYFRAQFALAQLPFL